MFNVLRQNVSGATLFQLAIELSWVFIAILLVIRLDAGVQHSDVALIAFVFAATIICLNGAFGLYRRSQTLSTVKKSQATIPAVCWRRNTRQWWSSAAVLGRAHGGAASFGLQLPRSKSLGAAALL